MKRIALFFSLICLILSLSACGLFAKKDSKDTVLYHAGLDLICVMEEMIQSEEYAEILGVNGVEELLEIVDRNDYDYPIAVYSISMPKTVDFLKITANYSEDQWNSLSDILKRQIENRVSFSAIVSMINGQQGAKKLAVGSLYTAFDKYEKIKVDDTTVYLYVFEEGIPIAITFTESGGVNGQFVFLEDIATLSNVRAVFEDYGCSVAKVDVPKQ